MDGYVMQVQDFCVNDGEGIRSTVFLAGCPLRCKWCANPEGLTKTNDMVKKMSCEEVIHQVQKQDIFFRNSGGGVTFSGGEATVQLGFLTEIVERFYDAGYNLAIETCGYFCFEEVAPILKKMNLIFMDFKHMDSKTHKRFTGVECDLIMENLIKTAKLGIDMVVRIPVIEGVNADCATLGNMFDFICENMPDAKIELLKYHKLGEKKYEHLGLDLPSESFGVPTEDRMEHFRHMAQEKGLCVVSY